MKVVRVPLQEIDSEKTADHVVDPHLRVLIKAHLNKIKENANKENANKENLKENLKENVKENTEVHTNIVQETDTTSPIAELYSDKANTQKVRNVRRFSYHQKLHPLRYDDKGKVLCYVRTDNNHHISFYRNPSGKIQEIVVSFFDYASLRRLGLQGVILDPKSQSASISEKNITLDDTLCRCIPARGAEHVLTLMKNQLYILGLSDKDITRAFNSEDIAFLSRHIYRVQGISSCNYRFALHTQSETALKNFNKPDGRFLLYSSISKFFAANPRQVIVDLIGRIKLL